jgi:hypothetical protein
MDERVLLGEIEEDVLRVGTDPLEPVGIVIGAGIKPDVAGNAFEVEKDLGAAPGAEIDDDALATALGRHLETDRRALQQFEILPREHGLEQERRTGCPLAELAMTKDDAVWLADRLEANIPAQTTTLMNLHIEYPK